MENDKKRPEDYLAVIATALSVGVQILEGEALARRCTDQLLARIATALERIAGDTPAIEVDLQLLVRTLELIVLNTTPPPIQKPGSIRTMALVFGRPQ